MTILDLASTAPGDEIILSGETIDEQTAPTSRFLLLDFEDCRLERIDLAGLTLEGSRFTNTSFVGCGFDGCDLSDTRFVNCRFDSTTLTGVELTRARLVDCTVDASKFAYASFFQAVIESTTFRTSSFVGVKFYETTMSDVRVWECALNDALFNDVVVQKQLDLRGSELEQASGLATVGDLVVDPAQAAALADWFLEHHRITVSAEEPQSADEPQN